MQELKAAKTDRKMKMLYTPKYHIPIGEVIDIGDSRKAIRIKKPGNKVTEDISFEYLVSAVANTENA
ncbi:MAG: hypothetical protein A2Y17_11365 [Clostridiales bacterium GWF2_38_85]|nr:MAG: hypothetical protein A2Y17_11365 [Clostridiales bacterium GWF2_38_85]HBL84724.1 hypothetical protein [Clostridiales bacterium]